MLRQGSSKGGKSGSITFLTILTISVLLIHAAVANAVVSFTSPSDGATLTSLPITVTGTQSAAATSVSLSIIQDPLSAVPPTGTGGATNQVSPQLTTSTTWEATLNLLNGTYRLSVSSDVDFPVSIDITVNVANNPGFLNCVTDPGGDGVQAKLINWNPAAPGAPSVNFNFSRSSLAADPELNASPTNYPVGTDFICTQDTGGRIPRVLIFGSDPLIDAFAGWSFNASTSTLTARMESVAATLPDGTPIGSAIIGLFALYDDDPLFPGTLPDLTGTYLAANASFSFTPVFSGGSITGLLLTLDGFSGSTAFFKAFFPNDVVNTFFGASCADVPLPIVSPASAIVTGPTVTTIPSLGCELSVDVQFASPVTVIVPLIVPDGADVAVKRYGTRGPHLPGMCSRLNCVKEKTHTVVVENLDTNTATVDITIEVDAVPSGPPSNACTVNGVGAGGSIPVATGIGLAPGAKFSQNIDLLFVCSPLSSQFINQSYVLRAHVEEQISGIIDDPNPSNNDLVESQTVK